MSAVESAKLVEKLRERGVIRADAPPMPANDDDRPWFIAILQGIAGWFSGGLLLLFIGMMIKPDGAFGLTFCGVILLVGAWALYFAARDVVFVEQLALALSIAGQFAVAWSVFEDDRNPAFISAGLLALQCAVFAIMPNRQSRTLSAFFACCAWVFLVRFMLTGGRSDHFFLDDDGIFSPPKFGSVTALVAWLLTWAPIVSGAWWLLKTEARWMASGARAFARPALVGLLLAGALVPIFTEPFTSLVVGLVDDASHTLTWWSLFQLLSIALTMFAAWCAFRLRSYGLLGLAIFAALAYLARFYYLYGTTLLEKSAIMLVLGAALLGVARLLSRQPKGAA